MFRRLGDDIIEIPKNTTTSVKIDKLPQYEFFAIKDERNTWAILETTSGLAVVQNAKSKKEAIEDFKQKINESIAKDRDFLPNTIKKNSLPQQYLARLDLYKKPAKTMTRPAAVRTSTATKTARKVIANRAAKSRAAAVKVKTASKTARKATATRTATKKAKSKPTGETGVLKYSKRLGGGKYEYKYVKKR